MPNQSSNEYTDGCEVAWFGCRRGAAMRRGGNSNNTLGQTRWTTSPEMASQAPEQKQWHSSVGLDEFVGHVLK
ncbi:unnamed protein product, partial [Ectocarpus sp. 12 AP-2014]